MRDWDVIQSIVQLNFYTFRCKRPHPHYWAGCVSTDIHYKANPRSFWCKDPRMELPLAHHPLLGFESLKPTESCRGGRIMQVWQICWSRRRESYIESSFTAVCWGLIWKARKRIKFAGSNRLGGVPALQRPEFKLTLTKCRNALKASVPL